jgi:hypothetical protein
VARASSSSFTNDSGHVSVLFSISHQAAIIGASKTTYMNLASATTALSDFSLFYRFHRCAVTTLPSTLLQQRWKVIAIVGIHFFLLLNMRCWLLPQ